MDDFDARRASLDLVTACVNHNKLSAAELPKLLGDVFKAISGFEIHAGAPAELDDKPNEAATKPEPAAAREKASAAARPASSKTARAKSSSADESPKAPPVPEPAVSIDESLADPGVIVSLITGEKFKMLKRHLTRHGLTEAEYRTRFNLPEDYPMVAPAYAALRRDVAMKMHAKNKNAVAHDKPAEAVASAVREETPLPVKAKAAPGRAAPKKASAPKKATVTDAGARKKTSARRVRAKGAIADATRGNAVEPAKTSLAGAQASPNPVPGAKTVPQSGLAKAAEAPKKAQTKKSAAKRRMARQPATQSKSADAAPGSAEDNRAAGASPAAAPAPTSPRPAARKPRKASGAPGTPEDGATAKPARKERRTLSPAYR